MKVLITGASGFVGTALVDELLARGHHEVVGSVRNALKAKPCELVETGDLSDSTDWSKALAGVDTVVHLAGRAHVLGDTSANRLNEFRRVNVDATVNLAKTAARMGVRRFVFVSSIGVNGGKTDANPFTEANKPNPTADYAVSKREAEQKLQALLSGTELELVIVRPPLVYAGHAPGNFRRLLAVIAAGLPLPFGRVRNLRTMIALENLVDLLIRCIDHPRAANEVFLCADDESLSLPEIVRLIASGIGRRVWLVPVPVFLLVLASSLFKRRSVIDQLCGSLVVDNQKVKHSLNWKPVVDARSALIAAGRNYLARNKEGSQ